MQRLVISAAFWSKPHLIALDEPTNYLDNDTLAALTQALLPSPTLPPNQLLLQTSSLHSGQTYNPSTPCYPHPS